MATSAVPAVKAALLTGLSARTGLAGVVITYGWPGPDRPREFIMLGDVPENEQRVAGMRATPHAREEDFTIELIVEVTREGVGTTAQQGATERAYTLTAEIENFLRNDLTAGASLTNGWAQITGITLVEGGDDTRRTSQLVVRVSCRARI